MEMMIAVDVEGNKGSVQIGPLPLGEERHMAILHEALP